MRLVCSVWTASRVRVERQEKLVRVFQSETCREVLST